MSDIAIRVENLSKAYRIGLKEQQHETMLGAAAAWIKSPFENYRNLRKLSSFDDVSGDAGKQKVESRKRKLGNGPSENSPQLSAFIPQPSDVIWALKDISFDVKHGEAVGFIGRNGAGKSTLLKILSRITEPTSGRATIHGRVASLLEVGTGFHPDLTGRENVYLNGTILGMRKREIDAKFDEILDFSGVEKFIDTPVKRYSSGMRVRLAFSVAAHLEPEILIVDEVLAVGDAEFQKKCLGKMGDVASQGRTVLFVSHNMAAVKALCRQACVLKGGCIDFIGDTSSAIARYLDFPSAGQDARTTLFKSKDRGGTGKLRFVNWTMREGVNGTGELRSGRPCRILLSYRVVPHVPLPLVASLSITLKDESNQALFSLATAWVACDPVLKQPEGTIECLIEELPLVAGRYLVHLWCSVLGEVADVVRDAGSVEVLPDDVFGTGKLPRASTHGPIIIRGQSWRLSE